MRGKTFTLRLHVQHVISAIDLLADSCSLSKSRIKESMIKGAVQLIRKNHKTRRIRRAQKMLRPGDEILFSYSEKLLAITSPDPQLILDRGSYSIWFKPSTLLTQGNNYGDHCSLDRKAALFFQKKRKIKLVHRLDRDACGLVILTHNRKIASYFSTLFHRTGLQKSYYAVVEGKFASQGENVLIDKRLDGKNALTEVRTTAISSASSEVDILLHTGRKHQIRRHLSNTGHPIVGDKLYGSRHPRSKLLHLIAYQLTFPCPILGKAVTIQLPTPLFTSLKEMMSECL